MGKNAHQKGSPDIKQLLVSKTTNTATEMPRLSEHSTK